MGEKLVRGSADEPLKEDRAARVTRAVAGSLCRRSKATSAIRRSTSGVNVLMCEMVNTTDSVFP
ncbi:MAG: hypothetical protein LC753_07140, partial [Acidobacteria bacterium]|nr:hypothetical protein [Acidobacteriota bacterium]